MNDKWREDRSENFLRVITRNKIRSPSSDSLLELFESKKKEGYKCIGMDLADGEFIFEKVS